MRIKPPEIYRDLNYSRPEDGNNGLFFIPSPKGSYELKVIASDGMDWDHVSVSLRNRCPNWQEMSFVKDLFFEPEETVVQFHPKASEYVNNHPYCLHLWRWQLGEHLLPPSILTGFKLLPGLNKD
jgi:hypothetical protein